VATLGLIPWKTVQKMLNACADGWRFRDKKHKRWLYYGDREPFKLPLGPHGKRQQHDLQIGHIRGLVRHLGISDCAAQHIEQLR
jgi:hypothetical protein